MTMAANEIVKANGSSGAMAPARATRFALEEIVALAKYVAESKLYPGIKTHAQAVVLLMKSDAEGLHPMTLLDRLWVIDDPDKGTSLSWKADAIQAMFQADGGTVEMIRKDDEAATAIFSHPVHCKKPIERTLTFKQCQERGITDGRSGLKKNWRQGKADMLWWRLVSSNIKSIHPGITKGMYTKEEVDDNLVVDAEVVTREPEPSPARPAPRGDVAVPGQPPSPNGLDERPYVQVVTEATAAVNTLASQDAADKLDGEIPPAIVQGLTTREVHKWLLNAAAQAGHYAEAPPSKLQHAVAILGRIYQEHRDWMREQLNMCFESHIHNCGEAVRIALERRAAEQAQDAAEAGDEPLEPLPAGAREPRDEG
jgi:hypothetical protein